MSLETPTRPPSHRQPEDRRARAARDETVNPWKSWATLLALAALALGTWGVFRVVSTGNQPPTTTTTLYSPTSTSSSTTTTIMP